MMCTLCFSFCVFLIYSFVGWTIEVISCSFKEKKFVNRGFLIGPYCPIYGASALLMIFFLTRYMDKPLGLFIIAMVIASMAEYVTSFVMEKLFRARWWDYSHLPFNVNGRICLTISFFFGALGSLLLYLVHPWVKEVLLSIYPPVLIGIAIAFFLFFLLDIIITFHVVSKIKVTAENVRKDYTGEITEKVKQILSSNSFLTKRLFSAFPNVKAIVSKIKKSKK